MSLPVMPLRRWSLRLQPLVLVALLTFTLVPVLLAIGLVTALLIGAAFCLWAGIEGLAALERWIETDGRFRR